MVKLIKETTQKQREKIIEEMFRCHNGDCENCGVCRIFKGTSPREVYKDYIEGNEEFDVIARHFNQRR